MCSFWEFFFFIARIRNLQRYGCELRFSSLIGKFFFLLLSYLLADNERYKQAFDYNNATESMLFERIVLCPNDFEINPPRKGVRENVFYTARMQHFNDATTDDDGAYVKSNNTKKNCYIQMTLRDNIHNNIDGNFYYNERNGRQYNVVNVDTVDIYTVESYYCQNKSIVGLKRLIVKIKKCNTGKYYDHFALMYSRDANVNEDVEILPHGNSKYTSERPYIRTSNKILEVEDQLLSSGYSVAEIYNKVLQESVGLLNSQLRSSKPRDKSLIYQWKNKKQKECTENNQKGDDLINSLNKPDLIQSIIIKKDSYFFFRLQIAK